MPALGRASVSFRQNLQARNKKASAESKFTASPLAGNDAIWFTRINDLGGWLAFRSASPELVGKCIAFRRER